MNSRIDEWLRQPLVSARSVAENRRARWLLLLVWLVVTLVLAAYHVPWRDEARAWSLMQRGGTWAEMIPAVQGEGHPFLWYMLLRVGHDLFGAPEMLRIIGFATGAAAVALLVLRGPFRIGVLALLAFSLHLGFEYTVIARNYGISALILLAIAALWPRIKDSLWLGLLLALLCNTNVPSVFLAGALAFYRLLELWEVQRKLTAPEWRRFAGNGVLLLLGTLACFLAVYPPANDAAAATGSTPLTLPNLLGALFTAERSFMTVGFDPKSLLGSHLVILSLLLFVRRPQALATTILALVCLKLFFFFVYPGYYRHSSLFFILLVALAWIEVEKGWGREEKASEPSLAMLVGGTAFLILMTMQTVRYLRDPVANLLAGRPYSHAADLARIMNRPEFRGSMLMIDPDSMGESVVYQTGRPYWLIRYDRAATLTPFSLSGNKRVTLDGILEQAGRLRARTGRPVIIALALPLDQVRSGAYDMMYKDYTVLTPDAVDRFKTSTRKIAALRHAGGDEEYDVYVYPR